MKTQVGYLKKRVKILYVGPTWYGSTSLQRFDALRRIGCDVDAIDTEQNHGNNKFIRAFQKLEGMAIDYLGINKIQDSILNSAKVKKYDILWIDKGLKISGNFIDSLKRRGFIKICVGFSADDMYQAHNQSSTFLKALPLYDLYLTTKSYNVAELSSLGARNVFFVGNSYDPLIHKPHDLDPKTLTSLGGEIGFIGAWEQERSNSLELLARSSFSVRWWCGWGSSIPNTELHPNLRIENKALWGLEYSKAISSFTINLCFLRKMNRDFQTTRSVEIPACKGFMLAERTDEHLELFVEGLEAEYFGCDNELVDKVKFYLSNDKAREKISVAGYLRCIKSGYSYDSRLLYIVNEKCIPLLL